MLNKIGIFTFLESLLLTILVGWASPEIHALLSSSASRVEIYSVAIPLLYVAPAIVIALCARIARLHDRLSDAFGLRKTFDVYRILIPLAGAVGFAVDQGGKAALVQQRSSAMAKTFYRFASFEEPEIPKAVVLHAIDAWTWYWILSELIVLLAITAISLVLLHSYKAAAYVLICAWILTVVFSGFYKVCGANADRQIDEIVSDPSRVQTLKEEFDRLLRPRRV